MLKKMKNSIVLAVIAVVAAGVAGCAAMRDPYPESTNPDAAKLVIARAGKQNMQVYGFKDSSNCTTPMNFGGTQLLAQGEERVVRLDPHKEIAFAFSAYEGTARCRLIVSFVPAAGKTYRATLNSDQEQCYVSLTRQEGVAEVRESSLRKRDFAGSLTESGPFCRR